MGLERMELDGLWDRVSLEYYLGVFIFEIWVTICRFKFKDNFNFFDPVRHFFLGFLFYKKKWRKERERTTRCSIKRSSPLIYLYIIRLLNRGV